MELNQGGSIPAITNDPGLNVKVKATYESVE